MLSVGCEGFEWRIADVIRGFSALILVFSPDPNRFSTLRHWIEFATSCRVCRYCRGNYFEQLSSSKDVWTAVNNPGTGNRQTYALKRDTAAGNALFPGYH